MVPFFKEEKLHLFSDGPFEIFLEGPFKYLNDCFPSLLYTNSQQKVPLSGGASPFSETSASELGLNKAQFVIERITFCV